MKLGPRILLLVVFAVIAGTGPPVTSAQEPRQPADDLWSEFPVNPGAGRVESPREGERDKVAPPGPETEIPAQADAGGESGLAAILAAALIDLGIVLMLIVAVAIRRRIVRALGAVGSLTLAVAAAPWRAGWWAGSQTVSAWDRARARRRARRERRRARRRERRDRRRRVAPVPAPTPSAHPEPTPRPVASPEAPAAAPPPQRQADLQPAPPAGRTVAHMLHEKTREIVDAGERQGSEIEAPMVEERSEICAISWRRGYAECQFYAQAVGIDGHVYIAATSPMFPWIGPEPPAKTKGALAAHRALVDTLRREGWEPAPPSELWYGWERLGRGDLWFEDRFRRGGRRVVASEVDDETGEERQVAAARTGAEADQET